jgi:hypothetical protein
MLAFINPIVVAGVWKQRLALGPTEYFRPEAGDRIQSPRRRCLNKRQDDGLCPE